MDLEDLATVSDTNTRIRDIARSVFARKYGNCLLSIDTFSMNADSHTNKFHMDESLINFKDRRIIRVKNPSAWCKIQRNFGESIKYIRLHYHRSISENFWRYMVEYISLYCTASLCALEVFECPSFPLYEPLTKLHTFIATGLSSLNQIDALEFMPNLQKLILKTTYWPKSMAKHFPNLEKVELDLDGSNIDQVHSLISFFCMNRQIEKLKLKICTIRGNTYPGLIYSAIIENLIQLKSLEITLGTPGIYRYFEEFTNAITMIPVYELKSIDTFGYRSNESQEIVHFEFNDLKKLILGPVRAYTDTDVINFILSNRKVKVLKFTEIDLWDYSSTFVRNFRQMMAGLPELVEVIIQPAKKYIVDEIWNKVLTFEWKLAEETECKNDSNESKMKFTRKS